MIYHMSIVINREEERIADHFFPLILYALHRNRIISRINNDPGRITCDILLTSIFPYA